MKKKRNNPDDQISAVLMEERMDGKMSVPTFDRRHVSWIRTGRQSSEVFCKNQKRRVELGLPIIYAEE